MVIGETGKSYDNDVNIARDDELRPLTLCNITNLFLLYLLLGKKSYKQNIYENSQENGFIEKEQCRCYNHTSILRAQKECL